MEVIATGQMIVYYVLGAVALAVEVYAFADCVRRPTQAFPMTGNQTKVIWLLITGIAMAVGFVFLGKMQSLGLLNIVAFVACMVYLAKVKPAVEGFGGGRGSRGSSSGW